MNLICPHCRKTITVGDDLAGKQTRCQFCSGPLTVPIPPAPTSPSHESTGSSPAVPELSQGSAPSAPGGRPLITGDYRPRLVLALHPAVVRWLAPAGLVVLFVLFFFPWLGSELGGRYEYSQSGFGAAFAFAGSPVDQSPGYAPWLILEFLLLVLSVVAAAGLVAATLLLPTLKATLPPPVKLVLDHRSYFFGALSLLCFIFLSLQLVMGFPAEHHDFTSIAPPHFKEDPAEFQAIMHAVLYRTIWLRAAFTVSLLAVLGALADFWLERRVGRPLPKLQVEW
jgi:hypothetical protein